MSGKATNMGLIGVKFDLFGSLLNLCLIEGFHAYLLSKNKVALFQLQYSQPMVQGRSSSKIVGRGEGDNVLKKGWPQWLADQGKFRF